MFHHVVSDGNTNDSIRVTKNMKFDFKDKSDPPSLQDFKNLLLKQLVKSAFFQNVPPLQINMLKLPLIMPSSLLGTQTNSDVDKKSLLDRQITYSPETFTKFTEMMDAGKIDVLGIKNLTAQEISLLGKEIGIKNMALKSDWMVKNEIINMSNKFLSGQGPCHGYTCKRGQTGGFTDVYCDHLFKVATKVQSVQESVR